VIIQLNYRDNEIPSYVTRVTVKDLPHKIFHGETVFQKTKIVIVGHTPVHQYREVRAVHLSSIELNCALSLKLKPKNPSGAIQPTPDREVPTTSVLAIARPPRGTKTVRQPAPVRQ
jgi:hypothetical protein